MGVTSSSIEHGTQEGRQELEDPLKGPGQEEGGRRWQGQEEEVVERKDPRQVEQLGSLRPVHIYKLYKEVPAYKLITPAVVSERLKIRGSLARKALNELQQKGL